MPVFMSVSCPEISVEEYVYFESVRNTLRKIDDIFPCYLGSTLVYIYIFFFWKKSGTSPEELKLMVSEIDE